MLAIQSSTIIEELFLVALVLDSWFDVAENAAFGDKYATDDIDVNAADNDL